jgi:hypothetical protein
MLGGGILEMHPAADLPEWVLCGEFIEERGWLGCRLDINESWSV